MDSRFLTIGYDRTYLGVRRQPDSNPIGIRTTRADCRIDREARSLSLLWIWPKALRLGESAVAAARVEPDARISRNTASPPIAEFRYGRAALPAHSKIARGPSKS